jgi:hypothetical protein
MGREALRRQSRHTHGRGGWWDAAKAHRRTAGSCTCFGVPVTAEEALGALAKALAPELARAIVAELHRGIGGDHVTQADSPAGARRFIRAIRSSKLPGSRVGRTWIATRTDHEAWLRSLGQEPAPASQDESEFVKETRAALRKAG